MTLPLHKGNIVIAILVNLRCLPFVEAVGTDVGIFGLEARALHIFYIIAPADFTILRYNNYEIEYSNIYAVFYERNFQMIYKTIVIDYAPKAKKMAASIEEKANEMSKKGYELVTFSITNSAKAILVFRASEEKTEVDILSAAAEAEVQ